MVGGRRLKHYAARQRRPGGPWDWTVEEEGRIFPAGPCVLHGDGHPTREEAERHFYAFDLQTLSLIVEDQDHKSHQCGVPWCKVFTDQGFTTKFRKEPQWLCDEHRIRHIFEMLNPFVPGITVEQP